VSSLLTNIADSLLKFSQERRILRVKFAPNAGFSADAFLPHQLTGSEGICEAMDYRLRCLTTDIGVPLKSLIGVPLAMSIENDQGGQRDICGIITGASELAADGGFTLLELHIEDALSILRHRSTWRIFRNQSIRDVTETILTEHLHRNSVLARSFQFSTDGLKETYAAREFRMQAGESDFNFLTRIWRREGICWYFSHAIDGDSPVHTLHFADSPNAWKDNPAGSIRFHRADATERTDTITAFESHRQFVPGAYQAASYDYKATRNNSATELSAINQGKAGNALAAGLTKYHYAAPHAADSQEEFERVARKQMQAYEHLSKHFCGEGVVRALSGSIATVFALTGHPEIDTHSQDERRFVLTRIELSARNNLLLDSTVRNALHLDVEGPIYSNRFECVRANVPIVPTYDPACVPNVGPISVRVTGNGDKEIDVDDQGRIAVRFLFTLPEEHAKTGASDTASDSARLRVASPWADAGFGATFWPRVGSEGIVFFLQNDPDKPVFMANINNASRTPTRFAGKGSLPGNSALYGIRSKEVKGTGFGELLFDDSTGETKTKLSSEVGATQLNQGWIGHPRTDGSSEKRGEGLEARTDLAGAIRAAQGLLISTDARPNASGQVLDRQELIGQLETALAIAKQLAELATTHEAGGTDTAPAQKLVDEIKNWDTDKPGGAAAIAVSGAAGVAVSSPNSVTTAAGTNLDMIAVQDANLSAGRKVQVRAGQGLSMFVPQEDAKLIAATGKIQAQAQANEMELGAAKRMHVYSLESLLFEAPQIVLRTDGAEIIIGNGKIVMSSSAPVEVKAPSFNFGGGGGGNTDLPNMPHSTLATDERIAFSGRSGKGRENLPYEVRDTAGAVQDAGKSAANGATQNTITDSVIKALTVHLKP